MKKILAIALVALIALSTVFAGGSSEKASVDKPTKIKASGKLVVGTEAQYAPYEFKDADANFVGCDIWLAQQIADELGVKLEIVDMSFDGIIPAVTSGQVDIGIAAFTATPERAEVIDFSSSYETATQFLVVKAGNEDVYSTLESLKGKKVGAQKGTFQSQLILEFFTGAELFELAKYPALALEVQNGNIVGLVADQSAGQSIIDSSDGKLVNSHFDFSQIEGAVGTKNAVVQKGNPEFLAAVNKVIDKVVADGSFQAEFDKAVALAATLGL